METHLDKIMPYQLDSFNNDHFISEEFLRLKEKFNLKYAIETGSAYGSTTIWLANHFQKVFTIDCNSRYLDVAKERANNKRIYNITFYLGSSDDVGFWLALDAHKIGNDSIFFLDAHWNDKCPLLDELNFIWKFALKPAIVIHDMKNPDDARFGFDKYNGQEFTFEWVKPSLDRIYGEDGYVHYFNTGFKKESAQRGVLYCHPKI